MVPFSQRGCAGRHFRAVGSGSLPSVTPFSGLGAWWSIVIWPQKVVSSSLLAAGGLWRLQAFRTMSTSCRESSVRMWHFLALGTEYTISTQIFADYSGLEVEGLFHVYATTHHADNCVTPRAQDTRSQGVRCLCWVHFDVAHREKHQTLGQRDRFCWLRRLGSLTSPRRQRPQKICSSAPLVKV